MPSVAIGPEFFQKVKNDYTNFKFALVREFMQNSVDAKGSTKITFTTNGSTLTVENNGEPMTEDVLVNKFLALGGTTKGAGDIGGFGVAKSLLCFMHKSYQIRTGTLLVTGSGAEYQIQRDLPNYHGTTTIIEFHEGDETDIAYQVAKIASFAQWHGDLYLDGELLSTNHHKGKPRLAYSWCNIYTNRLAPGRMVIRVNGIPMYTRSTSLDKNCVVVELTGDPKTLLTANRDGLRHQYSDALNDFVTKLAVDTKSAFHSPTPVIHHYKGRKVGVPQEFNNTAALSRNQAEPEASEDSQDTTPNFPVGNRAEVTTWVPVSEDLQFNVDFLVKNNTGIKVPQHLTPGTMSAYGENLVHVWREAIIGIMKACNIKGMVTLGFIFDEDREAEHYRTEKFGHVLLINPSKINTEKGVMSNRWNMTANNKWNIISIAAHEMVHYLGRSMHDEGFAGALTDMIGKLLANRKVFGPCFRKAT